MKRAIIIVIDSMGIGAMPDAPSYNDVMECNTLANVAKANNGLRLPNMEKLGLGNIIDVQGVKKAYKPLAINAKMAEVSEGKDTTTGHWEITGLKLEKGFKTYLEFPKELIDEFIEKTGCGNILGNYPASGTAVIEDLGDEHSQTKYPIVYTSADSVFQIACNTDIIPLKTLYDWCEKARVILDNGYNISRVIARPFKKENGKYVRVSADRRDYSVPPSGKTLLNAIIENNGSVVGIGKIEDIFVQSGITHAIHTGTNLQGLNLTKEAISKKLNLKEIAINEDYKSRNYNKELIFTNLVDTDMLFGHRNDAKGYGKALEEIDLHLGEILNLLTDDDLLIITADHGCDPTVAGTDHTREFVPVLAYNKKIDGKNLEIRETFADIACTVSKWLDVPYQCDGESLV